MEIEIKLRVDDSYVFAALLTDETLAGFSLGPMRQERQRNTYYDTADGRVRAARCGLRVREIGASRIATVKCGGGSDNGLHQRNEWEIEVDGPDPATWPESQARRQALRLLDGMPPVPQFIVSTLRYIRPVLRDGREVAELCLDEGLVQAAGRQENFRELEVELKADDRMDDLRELDQHLRMHFKLEPEARSKLRRGLDLLDGKS